MILYPFEMLAFDLLLNHSILFVVHPRKVSFCAGYAEIEMGPQSNDLSFSGREGTLLGRKVVAVDELMVGMDRTTLMVELRDDN